MKKSPEIDQHVLLNVPIFQEWKISPGVWTAAPTAAAEIKLGNKCVIGGRGRVSALSSDVIITSSLKGAETCSDWTFNLRGVHCEAAPLNTSSPFTFYSLCSSSCHFKADTTASWAHGGWPLVMGFHFPLTLQLWPCCCRDAAPLHNN